MEHCFSKSYSIHSADYIIENDKLESEAVSQTTIFDIENGDRLKEIPGANPYVRDNNLYLMEHTDSKDVISLVSISLDTFEENWRKRKR
ncbi:MAG: hypothetical protein R2883_04415 [Caldisericia bacterium]